MHGVYHSKAPGYLEGLCVRCGDTRLRSSSRGDFRENQSSTSGEVILCGRFTRVEFTAISHPNTRIKRFI